MSQSSIGYRRLSRGFTSEAIENARRRYEDTDEPQACIAADFGVHRKTLDRLAKHEGWKLRKDRPPRDLPRHVQIADQSEQAVRARIEGHAVEGSQVEEGAGATPPAPSSSTMAERLERAVEQELRAVELMRALGGPHPPTSADAERIARTLASLTDTLYRVRRLRAPDTLAMGSDDFDDLPRDIDEFRLALARRIEAFVRSRHGGAVSAGGEASSADQVAS